MRAADALCEALKNEGVEHVFGIPGGANLPLYDAIYDAEFAHIQARHEQGAGHMAEGYAKASGRVGVAIATSGPGATNLVTPIADAMMDSVPTVFITGQVRTDLIGTDGFQEADVVGITLPVVKHSLLVTDPRQIPDYIHKAFHIASTGRPGPVLVDVPQDLIRADIDYDARHRLARAARLQALDRRQHQADPHRRQGARQLEAPRDLRRRRDHQRQRLRAEFREFCRTDELPVTLTVMGLGAFPAPDEQWLGMLGMHGTRTANYAMDEADLIVCVGARFDDRITGKLSEFAPRAKFVHIDIDPAEIGKNLPAHIPIVGDAKDVLPKLTPRVPGAQPRVRPPRRVVEPHPRLAVRAPAPLRGLLRFRDQAAVHGRGDVRGDLGRRDHHLGRRPAPDVGGAVLPLRKAAPLAQLGRPGDDGLRPSLGDRRQGRLPDDTVVGLTGDGSLIMTCQEMATAARHNIPVKMFLMNNGHFGMVRQWQELFWEKRYSSVEMGPSPDWSKLADAFGWTGMRCDAKGDLRDAMRTALETDGPVLLDVHVSPEENCYPMIPAGAAARDMVG